MVWLRWCSCGGVFVAVFLWWCSCGGVQKYYSSTTKYYSSTTKYYSSTTPYYSSTIPYYKVLLQYYSVLQSTTPVLQNTISKTSISCEASATFHRKSFQNDRFVRGFLQISQNKLPKRAFRAMLPTIFTEKASKMIVSCEASSKFHRTSFQNERFARCFLQISQKKLPK